MHASFHFPSWYFVALCFCGVFRSGWVWISAFCTSERALDDIALRGESLWFPFVLFLHGGTSEHNRRSELVIFLAYSYLSSLHSFFRLASSLLHSGLGDKVKVKSGARKKKH
jgi:hypothetical protein